MLYKDACNRKSNQQNLGTIKCSNLCTEIVEYSSPDEVSFLFFSLLFFSFLFFEKNWPIYIANHLILLLLFSSNSKVAVCNLASLSLPMFVKDEKTFDFELLCTMTKIVTRNLNKIIDINYYPVEEARRSNFRHRPIGIGVQGLADAFLLMKLPFESQGARELNKKIFETIYFAALTGFHPFPLNFSNPEGSPRTNLTFFFFQLLTSWPKPMDLTRLTKDLPSVRDFFSSTCGIPNPLISGTGILFAPRLSGSELETACSLPPCRPHLLLRSWVTMNGFLPSSPPCFSHQFFFQIESELMFIPSLASSPTHPTFTPAGFSQENSRSSTLTFLKN